MTPPDETARPSSTDELATRPLPLHLSFASGLLMGGADAIPGVSGGTIALIIGIYERFIDALAQVIRAPTLLRTRHGRDRLWGSLLLLAPLGAGVIVAYYVATKLLVGPQDAPGIMRRPETAPICYGFFFGLVAVSVREPWRRMRERGAARWIAAAIGLCVAASFAYVPHSGNEPAAWTLLFGGAGAIAIMLLPGVSGSLFLVIIGQYTVVTQAVHDRAFGTVGIFLAGIVLGVIGFVPVLRALLARAHDLTMATLTGLMAGSLFSLWPWKDSYEPKLGPMRNLGIGDQLAWVLVAAAAGGAVVWLLAQLERKVLARS